MRSNPLILSLLFLSLAACPDPGDDDTSVGDDDATELPSPTATSSPSASPTPLPSPSATPTATPPPTPSPTPLLCWTGSNPLDLYDMALMLDPSTLNLQILNTTTTMAGLTLAELREIRYTSYEYENCQLRPVELEAWIALPALASGTNANLPGVVQSHGLGGCADANSPLGIVRDLGVVGLAFSGPGQCNSQGTGSTPDHLFDTAQDPRNSWFWEHGAAAMRGLTVLESLQEVDPSRLGATGYSGGSLITYLVNGVDARVKAAVPVSAVGHLDLALAAAPVPGWEHNLLQGMTPPRDGSSAEYLAFDTWLDPKNFLATAHGPTLIINGAQDEFFPLNSTVATLDDLVAGGGEHRLLSVVNWDHGWYALFNSVGPQEDVTNAGAAWFKHYFGLDSALTEPMPQPTVEWILPLGGATLVRAVVPGGTSYEIAHAQLHWSVDGALTFATMDLSATNGGWEGLAPGFPEPFDSVNGAYYVEFKFRSGLLGLGPEFKVTTRPSLSANFVPNIIPIAGPLP